MIRAYFWELNGKPAVVIEFPDGSGQRFGPFPSHQAAGEWTAAFIREVEPHWPSPRLLIELRYPKENMFGVL